MHLIQRSLLDILALLHWPTHLCCTVSIFKSYFALNQCVVLGFDAGTDDVCVAHMLLFVLIEIKFITVTGILVTLRYFRF